MCVCVCVCVCVCALKLRWHLIPSPSSLDWQVNSPDQLQRSSLENLTRPSLFPQALNGSTVTQHQSRILYRSSTTHTDPASISLIKSLISEVPQYITTWTLVPALGSEVLHSAVCLFVCIDIFTRSSHSQGPAGISYRHTHHTSITARQEDTRSKESKMHRLSNFRLASRVCVGAYVCVQN